MGGDGLGGSHLKGGGDRREHRGQSRGRVVTPSAEKLKSWRQDGVKTWASMRPGSVVREGGEPLGSDGQWWKGGKTSELHPTAALGLVACCSIPREKLSHFWCIRLAVVGVQAGGIKGGRRRGNKVDLACCVCGARRSVTPPSIKGDLVLFEHADRPLDTTAGWSQAQKGSMCLSVGARD